MKILIFIGILGVYCEEMVVTQAYTDYLKAHASWEVADYEENIFRGWTLDEAKKLLGVIVPENDIPLPIYKSDEEVPESRVWTGNCIHEVRDQCGCGSCWAFATASMLSDRCCLMTGVDYGWLSPRELVSCDARNDGCKGGWPAWAAYYVVENKGLVKEACFKYGGTEIACPNECQNGDEWKSAHICNCYGIKQCLGVENIKKCLQTGPVAVTFEVTKGFFFYKEGIFECKNEPIGLHSVTATGYSTDPVCHWIVKNSWGSWWGNQGYFKMACDSCGMNGKYPNGNVICENVK